MNVTRLGIRGELIRCSVSRAVLAAEDEQKLCSGSQTAIGAVAYKKASQAVKDVFGSTRRRSGLPMRSPSRNFPTKTIRRGRRREPSMSLAF